MAFTTWLFTVLARRRVRKTLRAPLYTGGAREGEVVSVEGDVPETTLALDPARAGKFLLLHGVPVGVRRPRLAEWLVEDGVRVRVAGVLMRDPASEPDAGERDFRAAAPAELRLTGTYDHPLAIGLVR